MKPSRKDVQEYIDTLPPYSTAEYVNGSAQGYSAGFEAAWAILSPKEEDSDKTPAPGSFTRCPDCHQTECDDDCPSLR